MYFCLSVQLMCVIAAHSLFYLVLTLAVSQMADISFCLTVNSIKINFIGLYFTCKSFSIKPSAKPVHPSILHTAYPTQGCERA